MHLISNHKDCLIQEAVFNQNHYCKKVLFTNANFELVIIGWTPGQESKIHNHPDEGCLVFPINGSLNEKRFTTDLDEISNELISYGDISYLKGNDCLHSLHNYSSSESAITLHLYSPPHFSATYFETKNEKKFSNA